MSGRSQTPATEPAAAGVLLLSCYELGHPPHGLASPAAFLHEAGIPAELVDVSVEPLRDDQIDAARFVAISVPMHTALQLGRRVAQRIRRRNPSCSIAFFGHYAHLHAELLLECDADLVLGGESEAALVEAIRQRQRGETPPRQGLVLQRLRFPLPRRQALPGPEAYARLEWHGEQRLAGYLESTRGCRHRCRHCPIPAVYAGRLFAVDRQTVLADARQQIAAGARHLTFGDPDFLNAPGQGLRILDILHAEFPEVTFDCTARIEHLLRHARLLPQLVANGVLFIVSAVETLNDEILAVLDKGHNRQDVLRAHAMLEEVGITLRPTFLPFTPWTKWRDLQDIVHWVEEADLVDCVDVVQYSIRLLVPRGSLLEEHASMRPYRREFDAASLSWNWRYEDERLDALQRDLARVAQTAAARHEDAQQSFARVRQLVCGPSGAHRRPTLVRSTRRHQRPPRLTEPWFC
jgi:radical SAM superfamily enzyme YgiQ (UPF0313 family)